MAMCSRFKGNGSREEVRGHEAHAARQRRQRDVTSQQQQHAEHHHGDARRRSGRGPALTPRLVATPLPPRNFEIDRKRMTEDRRQRDQHRQVDGTLSR